MTWHVTADPERFEEALAWFRSRFPVTDEILDALGDYATERAWRVAGVAQLDVVLDVFRELERAIETGATMREFRKSVGVKLAEAWGKSNAHRIETIYLTNLQKAYNAGRWRQVNDPQVARTRPYLMFDAILDSRTSDICKKRNGTVLLREDPWWHSNMPPLHHRCRSTVRSLRAREAERYGISGEPPRGDDPAPGFGMPPTAEPPFAPDPSKYPDKLFQIYAAKQAARSR